MRPTGPLPVIIHGHFYQPPRDMPDTGRVPFQPSATSHHNWNDRIIAECYRANCHSPVMDGDNVAEVINTYAYLSFNFGPTLLNYISMHAPDIIEALQEADKLSVQRLGHGNAMSQVYSHRILPLATPEDMKLQIDLGIADFQRIFGRDCDGMWLSETAINEAVAEQLVAAGIKFVLLAPSQAGHIRRPGDTVWHSAAHHNIEHGKPYLIHTSQGSLKVLFYHGAVSQAIAFEHLLTDSYALESRFFDSFESNPEQRALVLATDGESYGHHEHFGDMALAALIHRTHHQNHLHLTNPGAWLSSVDPAGEVRLARGEDGLGTAWSCPHGLGRWTRNCGCRFDSSTQQHWRKPLYEAMTYMSRTISRMRDEFFSSIGWAFNEASKAFLPVVAEPTSTNWAQFQLNPKVPFNVDNEWDLMIWLRTGFNVQLMQASCTWFFDDISGIEATHSLRIAKHVFRLLSRLSRPPDLSAVEATYREMIAKAPVNYTQETGYHTGDDVYEDIELSDIDRLPMLLAYIIWRNPQVDSMNLPPTIPRFQIVSHMTDKSRDSEYYTICFVDVLTGFPRVLDIEISAFSTGLPIIRWTDSEQLRSPFSHRFDSGDEVVLSGEVAAEFELSLTHDEDGAISWQWDHTHALVGSLAMSEILEQSDSNSYLQPRLWQWETVYRDWLRRAARQLDQGRWPVHLDRDLAKARSNPFIGQEFQKTHMSQSFSTYLMAAISELDIQDEDAIYRLNTRILRIWNAGIRLNLQPIQVMAHQRGIPLEW